MPATATSTSFVSNARAWAALPETIQAELRPLRGRHFYDESQPMTMDWPILEYWHPVCVPHRATGEPMLYVTEHHVDRISGLTEARSRELLDMLFATLYHAPARYEHVWRLGDLLIWDNFAVQHARTRAAPLTEGPRILQRVSLGREGFATQLERVRRAAHAAERV